MERSQSHFREELDALQGRLLEMGGLAEERVRAAIQGLVSRDPALIEQVLRSDEPMTALYERFRTVQTGRGWEETVSVLGAEGAMLGFRKDARGVVANFRPDMEGRTLVSLSLQPQVLPAPR